MVSKALCVPRSIISSDSELWIFVIVSPVILSNGNIVNKSKQTIGSIQSQFGRRDERARLAVWHLEWQYLRVLLLSRILFDLLWSLFLIQPKDGIEMKWNPPNLHLDFPYITFPAGITMTLRCIISALGSGHRSGRKVKSGTWFCVPQGLGPSFSFPLLTRVASTHASNEAWCMVISLPI